MDRIETLMMMGLCAVFGVARAAEHLRGIHDADPDSWIKVGLLAFVAVFAVKPAGPSFSGFLIVFAAFVGSYKIARIVAEPLIETWQRLRRRSPRS